MSKGFVGAAIALGFIGGLITLGGLAALQSDTPDPINSAVKPYRWPWFVWSFEVFTLLYAIFALFVDLHRLGNSLLSLVAIVTSFVAYLINDHIYHTSELPGNNGSATRGNVTIAGLIIVAIANFFIIFSTALYSLTAPEPPRAPRASTVADESKGTFV